ncbi:DNA mismatch repair protein MutS2 [Melghiribacillus thermohalophilus]|uniref:Endonuclease MutS2 n=1 Tax=Melghiribacillus thermohalophilus TaxID=1324956 RepID=A0A4R3N6Z3_9BACI|nr:endonuclease MutS2 [Melghiribacillus thermohalophilus]TCT25050.1 DNA mismatch repair protein MutS2 [Melghiribacillus thermohalophilus]
MNDRVYKVLEFDKVIHQLKEHASSSPGKELVATLEPSTNLEEVVRWQEETDEAFQVLRVKGHIPLGGIKDIRPSIKRAKIGGMLQPDECLDVASVISASKTLKRFIEEIDEVDIPILKHLSEEITPLNELERSIKSCIDDHGQVLDSASDRLRSVRRQIRSFESRIRDKLEHDTRTKSKMLSDAIITIRNDRYVLPVKQEYRGAFGGIVHDQSSSGATLFIEPGAVVELNNELQEARSREKQEIERILRELTEKIAQDAEPLNLHMNILSKIDFMTAKAKYARKIKGTKPEMNDRGIIDMKQARHPLIPAEEVVANDISIGKDSTAIVITGPNTGGKTVTLKMVGLTTLMAQSGLMVPALDGCKMAVFEHVFADIGDEQSIEQSLSTFSSHMTNIVDILNHVNDQTLVLFDELGAGTDPQEGAALAMAILDEVVERNARVIATTHYPELKAYGYNREQVINASVDFDVKTLKPTYRLLIGVPGRSNAFEISRKLGLSEEIIHKSKTLIGRDSQSVENMIASLEESRRKADQDYEEAAKVLDEAANLLQDLKRKWKQFEQKKEHLYKQAEEKAKKEVEKAKQKAEEIIDELRSMQQQAHIKEHQLIDARKQLEEAQVEFAQKNQSADHPASQQPNKSLQPGDEVKVLSLNQEGHIVEQMNDSEYQVQLGIMKVKVNQQDLQFIHRPESVKEQSLSTVKGSSYHVKPELDLRGERYEDALHRLEKYIDDAILAGYPQVSIIHGKGTGALRQAVQNFAKQHPSIQSSRLGGMNEGGSGVTVLKLG